MVYMAYFKDLTYRMYGKILLGLLLIVGLVASISANDVIPDGSTNTHIQVNQDGAVEVAIAPANPDRTSINRYHRFDVGEAGLSFNNREVAARTIVNEVTGGSLSTIAGRVEVLGTQAHLVIANTNGISINGANFINTADTILSTGSVSTVERQLGPGLTQVNTLLETQAGVIVVGEKGISGAMSSLDMIAKSIEINGLITNTNAGRRNQVRLYSGASTTELDSSHSPANPTRNAAVVTQLNTNSDEILIHMDEGASIDAASIFIGVNAKGAGVNLDGKLIARTGDIQISVNGMLSSKASILSAGGIVLNAVDGIALSSNAAKPQVEVSAGNGLLIRTEGELTVSGVKLSAVVDPADSANAIDIVAKQGITLESLNKDHLGILFAASGGLKLSSEADINNWNGRIIGNANVLIETPGEFNNLLSYTEFEGRGELHQSRSQSSKQWYTLFLKRKTRTDTWADYGEQLIEGELPLVVADGKLRISASVINNFGGDLLSNGGQVELVAPTVHNEAIALGELRFSSRCLLGCDRYGSSTLELYGGGIKSATTINIDASTAFNNIGGVVLGLDDTVINSPQVLNQAITLASVMQRPKGLTGFFDFDTATLFRQDQGGALMSNMGKLIINSEDSLQLVGGVLTAGSAKEIPGGVEVVRERINQTPISGTSIGALGNI